MNCPRLRKQIALKALPLMTVCLAGVGCASIPKSWSKPGATAKDFEDDKYACAVHAGMNQQRFYFGQLAGFQAIADSQAQVKAFNACMQAYGWAGTDPEDATNPSAADTPESGSIRQTARAALPKFRNSAASDPTCGLGVRLSEEPVIVLSASQHAQAAGLTPGLKLVGVDDERISSEGEVGAALSKRKPGQRVKLIIVRDGREQTTDIECLDPRPSARAVVAALEATADGRWSDCISQTYEIERFTGPSALPAAIRMYCNDAQRSISHRTPNNDDALLLYEFSRRRLLEASFSPDGIEPARGEILKAMSTLEQWQSPTLAQDLRSKLDLPIKPAARSAD